MSGAVSSKVLSDTEEYLLKVSSHVFDAIQKARSSPVLLGHIDLFIGPLIGRHTNMKRLETLALEIGRGGEFQPNQALLAVFCDYGPARKKLLVIGGGHRLLVCARQMMMLFLPYQIVDFTHLRDRDLTFDIKDNEGIVSHHVESSEPRPLPFGLMHQVVMYGKLKSNWRKLHGKRMKALRIPRSKVPAMTHRKLWTSYNLTKRPAGQRSNNIIAFLDSMISDKSRSQYMSGADRLLRAGVIEDLCRIECVNSVTFGITSLNIVRLWPVDRIKNTVRSWIADMEKGKPCKFKFSNTMKKKVVTKSKAYTESKAKSHERSKTKAHDNLKAKSCVQINAKTGEDGDVRTEEEITASCEMQSSPDGDEQRKHVAQKHSKMSDLVSPPRGWEGYIDWSRNGSLELLQELRQKLLQEEAMDIESLGANVHVIEDNHDMLRIVDSVKEKVETELRGSSGFDLAKLIRDQCVSFEHEHREKEGVVVDGGVLGKASRLVPAQILCIETLHNANDVSLLFTLNYLNNWTEAAIHEVFVVDPLLTKAWWEKPLRSNETALKSIQSNISAHKSYLINTHELVWRKNISLLFLCGMDHWTLAVALNLPSLLRAFEKSKQPNSKRPIQDNHGAKVICIDSIKNSVHTALSTNIIRYLHSSYPGKQSLSFTALRLNLKVCDHRQDLQKRRECGFYCTYFASLVAKNTNVFLNGTVEQIITYLDNAAVHYSFSQYSNEIHTRLRLMRNKYEQRRRTAIRSNIFYWPSNAVAAVNSTAQVSNEPASKLESLKKVECSPHSKTTSTAACDGDENNSSSLKLERISKQVAHPVTGNNGKRKISESVGKTELHKEEENITFIVEEGNNLKKSVDVAIELRDEWEQALERVRTVFTKMRSHRS